MLSYGFVSFIVVFLALIVFVIGLMFCEERAERKRMLFTQVKIQRGDINISHKYV